MSQRLVLTIRLHDARYHGVAEWPPAPARAFQALVAGAARGAQLAEEARAGLAWLEQLAAPTIAAPRSRVGQRIDLYVPNNDADTLDGDLGRLAELRVKKAVAPRILDDDAPFVYAWPFADAGAEIEQVMRAADDLYQFGRGIDPAWATVEVIDGDALEDRLADHGGTVHRPTGGEGDGELACPAPGSLASLIARHAATRLRLREGADGRTLFWQPPKARFASVTYDAPATRHVFELRRRVSDAVVSWPIADAVALVECVRDGAADRLRAGLPEHAAVIARVMIGRRPEGVGPSARVRLIPLPSIGHPHADRAIRRIVVETPSGCELAPADVAWACSGFGPIDPRTGEERFVLTPSDDLRMLRHFTEASRRWHTVTPAALPEVAGRRRIEPGRRDQAKDGAERLAEERRAIGAVKTALRHAGIAAVVEDIHVQREPFEKKGSRAEVFATPRFAKERLWHVALQLRDPIAGPIAIGDGRFLGLGIMSPVTEEPGVEELTIESGLADHADPIALARALRRAVMSRVQAVLGRQPLPAFFSGHQPDGSPARGEEVPHLAFHFDGGDRLLIIAPHRRERRAPTREERRHLQLLAEALDGMVELRAGAAGLVQVRRGWTAVDHDALLAPARTWVSRWPYAVNRHRKAGSAEQAVIADVLAAPLWADLPRPAVTVADVRSVAGRGLEGFVTLRFPVAVAGPIVLGRTRHLGGGLFVAVADDQ